MPFLRFSRDKRGYEHTYLLHASSRKGAAARILYWYRTPPGVKVGRAAFDEDVRKALEAQYPSIQYDWDRLMETPPPPPDVEHWRERRRLERAARQARQAAEREGLEEPEPSESEVADVPAADRRSRGPSATDRAGGARGPDLEPPRDDDGRVDAGTDAPVVVVPPEPGAAALPSGEPVAGADDDSTGMSPKPRRRRRRGGRRRRRPGSGTGEPGSAESMDAAAEPGANAESADVDDVDEPDDEPDEDGPETDPDLPPSEDDE